MRNSNPPAATAGGPHTIYEYSDLSVPNLDPDVDIHTAAQAYAECGWYVLPVAYREKKPGSVVGNNWHTKSSRDAKQITAWFAATDYGIGLHCGPSGAAIADVDTPENLPDILAKHKGAAPIQQTRPNQPGRDHIIFAAPPGRKLGNSRGRLPGGWGDIRGGNAIIVAFPSVHAEDDGQYRWLRTGPVPYLPADIADLLPDGNPAEFAATNQQVAAFLAEHQGGEHPDIITAWRSIFTKRVAEGGSRHDTAVSVCAGAMKEARAQYFPADAAEYMLRKLFVDSATQHIAGKRARTEAEAHREFDGILAWAIGQANAADLNTVKARTQEKMTITPAVEETLGATTSATLTLDDSHVAEYLSRTTLSKHFRWAAEFGWLKYKQHRWERVDETRPIQAVRRGINRLLAAEVDRGADADRLRRVSALFAAGRIRAITGLIKGDDGIHAKAEDFDAHPHLLGVGNGVVDLRTGELLPHNADLLITRHTTTHYTPGASHPDWDTALASLPQASAKWMQQRLGQAATGHPTPDDVLPILQGRGANGKTTILGAVQKALGDHAVTVPERVLLANPSDHPTELMTLYGARLAVIEETPEVRHINVHRLKTTLGSSRISARYIARNNVEWSPTHSLVVSTNYRPRVDETDHGTWRRLALVTFPYVYCAAPTLDHHRLGDPTLRQRLTAGRDGQLEAVLAWIIDGAIQWYTNGQVLPQPPDNILADTAKWRYESDVVAGFVAEAVEFDADRHIASTDLLKAFNGWLERAGHRPWSDQLLGQRLQDHDCWPSGVTKSRVLASKPGISRPTWHSGALPTRFTAWSGVRFKESNDRAE